MVNKRGTAEGNTETMRTDRAAAEFWLYIYFVPSNRFAKLTFWLFRVVCTRKEKEISRNISPEDIGDSPVGVYIPVNRWIASKAAKSKNNIEKRFVTLREQWNFFATNTIKSCTQKWRKRRRKSENQFVNNTKSVQDKFPCEIAFSAIGFSSILQRENRLVSFSLFPPHPQKSHFFDFSDFATGSKKESLLILCCFVWFLEFELLFGLLLFSISFVAKICMKIPACCHLCQRERESGKRARATVTQ